MSCIKKVLFNIPESLKIAATKKAAQDNMSLSTAINFALKAYVAGHLKIVAIDRLFIQDLIDMREKNLISEKDFLKKLGL